MLVRYLSFISRCCFFLIIGLLPMLWMGCGHDDRPDVSNISIQLQTRRLDKDLAAIDTSHVADGLSRLRESYPDFLDFYLDTLMGFGLHGDYHEASEGIALHLKPFLSNKDIRGLFDTVQQHFPDTRAANKDLTQGFQYLKHYFPNVAVPRVIYFISGLAQWSVVTLDTNILGIGLDMYLGQQYPFYRAVQIPEYAIRKCEPAYIAPNAFQAIYRNMHPFVTEDRDLLDLMIQRGKEQYFLSKILPETPESVRLGFTEAQLDWCRANEAEVYNFFVAKQLLYDKRPNQVYRYVFDGPTATGMPPESPGNIGTWLGYQIIRAYMAQQHNTSMEQLFAEGNAQRILQASRYKPK